MAVIDDDGKLLWIIPESIDMPAIIRGNPPDFKPIIDHFYFILDYISSQLDYTDLRETKGYVNVNAEILQGYNRHYKKYRDFLVDNSILKSDNHFIRGEKSTGYIFNSQFLTGTVKTVPASKFVLAQKVKAYIKQNTKNHRHYSYLTKWFNSNLKINIDQAFNLTDQIYPLPIWPAGIRGSKRGVPNPWVQRFKAKRAIQMLAAGHFYYHVDETVGRLHTNLTNIKREIRKIITYSNQPLISIDISNAQPLLSAILLKPEFYQGKLPLSINKLSTIKDIFEKPSEYEENIAATLHYITLVLSSESQAGKAFQRFTKEVESGNFYSQASSIMFPGQQVQKKAIKTAIFQTFFSANTFLGQPEAAPKKAFSLAFPEVYNVFKLLKKKNKVVLAHLLQRIESFLMIECVAKRISTERPDLPIFTVHDSILTISGNEVYVSNVISDEIRKWTGLNAQVEIEC